MIFKAKKKNKYELDHDFLNLDKKKILRTKSILEIPYIKERVGGKTSYAEWAYVIGVFQTLFYQNIEAKDGNIVLDIGCGTGLLSMASKQLTSNGGKYIGLDVQKDNIDFCKRHYTDQNLEFIHFDVNNALYADAQSKTLLKWSIDDASIDVVTALSVWTHFNEQDALFYAKEVQRVLKPGGTAILTFFVLDDDFENFNSTITKGKIGKFYNTETSFWTFDTAAYQSTNWFYPNHCEIPEMAIGVKEKGIELILKNSKLKLTKKFSGTWKDIPGMYFQDILIFKK